MSLWGVGTNNESKPKWLTDEEKKNTYADERGWVYVYPDGSEEVLIAIGGLAGTSSYEGLGAPTVDRIEFREDPVTAGTDLILDVYYNEGVTVGGTPQVPVTGVTASMSFSNTESNVGRGHMAFTLDTTGESGTTVTLSASESINLNGGSITDTTDGSTAAELTLNNSELTADIS